MHKRLQILVGTTLMTALLAGNLIFASAATPNLAGRLAKYKTEFKTSLTRLQVARLKLRCSAAQGKVRSLSGRINGLETSRAKVYQNIANQLTNMQTRLQQKNIDTIELQAELTTLSQKIDGYKTDLAAYKQDVSDLAALDCKADPTAFKAALEAARAARLKVANDVTDIHSYLIGNIRATLVKLHDKVKAAP